MGPFAEGSFCGSAAPQRLGVARARAQSAPGRWPWKASGGIAAPWRTAGGAEGGPAASGFPMGLGVWGKAKPLCMFFSCMFVVRNPKSYRLVYLHLEKPWGVTV